MAWFDKHKQTQRRAELERKALAASVQELAAQEDLTDAMWDEEDDPMLSRNRTAIIPPLLRLQSRSLPAVKIDVDKYKPIKHEQARPENAADPVARSMVPGRRLGRSTRVHLQAVRPDRVPEPTTERVLAVEGTVLDEQNKLAQNEQIANDQSSMHIERAEADTSTHPASGLLSGSGVINQGQGEVTVPSPQISAQSVVTVMLAGNPGPVVVQYISLHPYEGFTFHLSAPVVATTPFNYTVWPC